MSVTQCLLEAGADPVHRDTTSMESAVDVAKTDDIRNLLVSKPQYVMLCYAIFLCNAALDTLNRIVTISNYIILIIIAFNSCNRYCLCVVSIILLLTITTINSHFCVPSLLGCND